MAASCRRSPFERHRRVLAVCAVAAGSMMLSLWPARAYAAELPSTYCPLSRPPDLSWLQLAKGDDCSRDEDGNGLDDEIETQLARCFVPEIAFDTAENALRPDEPHVVFSANPLGPRSIRLHFAFLFARDGGYVLGADFPCLVDDHDGDVESVTVDAIWLERDRRWFAAPVSMSTGGPPGIEESRSLATIPAAPFSGTHPVLYATAGKHHWLQHPASLSYACDCGFFGRCGAVRDRADGNGIRVVANSLWHAPGFYVDREADASRNLRTGTSHRVRTLAPSDKLTGNFLNACEFRTRGTATPARSLGTNDLDDLGYEGEHIFGSCFRGGGGGLCAETISVAEAIAWDRPFAADVGARKLLASLLNGHDVLAEGETGPKLEKGMGWSVTRMSVASSAIVGLSQLLGRLHSATPARGFVTHARPPRGASLSP